MHPVVHLIALQVDIYLANDKREEAVFAYRMTDKQNRAGLCLGLLYLVLWTVGGTYLGYAYLS